MSSQIVPDFCIKQAGYLIAKTSKSPQRVPLLVVEEGTVYTHLSPDLTVSPHDIRTALPLVLSLT